MPNSLASFKWSQSSALNSSALVGMQPTCRQVPPRNPSFSMSAVFKPYWPARIAAVYPAGPLPMMATSYKVSGNGGILHRRDDERQTNDSRTEQRDGPRGAVRAEWTKIQ